MRHKVVLASLAAAAVLAGCGATASSPDDDRHANDCMDRGGSYSYNGNDGSWSCKMPPPIVVAPGEVSPSA